MADKRLYQAVAERIKKRIADGDYEPGSRLPGERELADAFEVSRVTIREAEIALQATGYITIKTGSGAYVLDRSAAIEPDMPQVSALELTEARLLFESEAAGLAARSIDDDTLARLEALLAIISSNDDAEAEAAQQADREFHLTVAAASQNKAVQHTVENLWRMRTELPQVRSVHAAVCENETAAERRDEHSEVLQALKDRDSAAARHAMQQHFARLLAAMIDVTEAQAVADSRNEAAASRQRFLTAFTQPGRA